MQQKKLTAPHKTLPTNLYNIATTIGKIQLNKVELHRKGGKIDPFTSKFEPNQSKTNGIPSKYLKNESKYLKNVSKYLKNVSKYLKFYQKQGKSAAPSIKTLSNTRIYNKHNSTNTLSRRIIRVRYAFIVRAAYFSTHQLIYLAY